MAEKHKNTEKKRTAERTMDVAPEVKLYLAGDKGLIVAREHVDLKEPLKIDGAEVMLHGSIYRGQQRLIELNTSM